MPAELAAIQADLEKAHKNYRLALDEVQSLTLLKVEKQTVRDDLFSKLMPFTESDGVTPKPPIVNAWCADLTETLSPQTPVATVEIPGERQLGVRIRPQFGTGNQYTAARDGLMQPSFASSPEATFWNWALHPGTEKWRPRYRLGRVQVIDSAKQTCTVLLDTQKTGESTRARDGQTLDVNAPLKTLLDPQSGQQRRWITTKLIRHWPRLVLMSFWIARDILRSVAGKLYYRREAAMSRCFLQYQRG